MTFPNDPQNSSNDFIPENWEWPDVESKDFLYELKRRYRRIASNLNNREIGVYNNSEYLTGEQWFDATNTQNKKLTFRKVFPITDASLNFAHNITGVNSFTHIYGTGYDSGTGLHFPLPFVNVTNVNNQIQIDISSTNIIITKGGGSPPAITSGFLVLEYLKN